MYIDQLREALGLVPPIQPVPLVNGPLGSTAKTVGLLSQTVSASNGFTCVECHGVGVQPFNDKAQHDRYISLMRRVCPDSLIGDRKCRTPRDCVANSRLMLCSEYWRDRSCVYDQMYGDASLAVEHKIYKHTVLHHNKAPRIQGVNCGLLHAEDNNGVRAPCFQEVPVIHIDHTCKGILKEGFVDGKCKEEGCDGIKGHDHPSVRRFVHIVRRAVARIDTEAYGVAQ